MAELDTVVTKTSLEALPKIAEGKVRDLYEVDSKTLLFVASDRISAYDVIMDNVSGPAISIVQTNCLFSGCSIKRQTPHAAVCALVQTSPNIDSRPQNSFPHPLPPLLDPRVRARQTPEPLNASSTPQNLSN